MININSNSYLGYRRRGGFSAEYQAVYDSWIGKPSAAVAAQQDLRVRTLVTAGTWAKKDFDYVLAAHTNDNGEALSNWFNPGTFDGVMVNAPVFVAFEGITGDGATSYVRSNWTPNADAINYVLDSASLGVYIRNNLDDTNVIGCDSEPNWTNITPRAANLAFVRINADTFGNVANTDSRGDFISARLNANDQDLYKNKVKIVDGSVASVALPNDVLWVCALNRTTPQFSPYQVARAFASSGYTQADVTVETDSFEVYMDSNGKGVIP